MNNEIEEYLDKNEVSEQELVEHMPILKPVQVETIMKNIDLFKFNDVNAFLPYLDDETITFLAQQKLDKKESRFISTVLRG